MSTAEQTLAEVETLIRGAKAYKRSLTSAARNIVRRALGLKAAIRQAREMKREMARMSELSGWLPDEHRAEIEARLLTLKTEILQLFARGDF